jgi:hypothetical protein
MDEIMSGIWENRKFVSSIQHGKRQYSPNNQEHARVKQKNPGRRKSVEHLETYLAPVKTQLSPVDQTKLFKVKLNKSFGTMPSIASVESPNAAKFKGSTSLTNSNKGSRQVLPRSSRHGLTQGGSHCGQGHKPRSLDRPRMKHAYDRLNAAQRRAVCAFEFALSKMFLQQARRPLSPVVKDVLSSYGCQRCQRCFTCCQSTNLKICCQRCFKFVRPLSPTDFSNLVSQLIGVDPSSALSIGGLGRSEAEACLFAKYASADGKVHYQPLAEALQRANETQGHGGHGGVDQSKEGVRNVWGAVMANKASSNSSSSSSSRSGGGAFTNPLGAKFAAVQTSLMTSGPAAEIFGAGFPLGDVCTQWKVRWSCTTKISTTYYRDNMHDALRYRDNDIAIRNTRKTPTYYLPAHLSLTHSPPSVPPIPFHRHIGRHCPHHPVSRSSQYARR